MRMEMVMETHQNLQMISARLLLRAGYQIIQIVMTLTPTLTPELLYTVVPLITLIP
jgi:hypothetical protein